MFTDIKNPSFDDGDSEMVFEKWCCIDIGNHKLYFDPSLIIGTANENEDMLVILGLVLNPFDGLTDSQQIAEKLLSFKTKSNIEFIEYLNQLSGRFVVIYKQGRNFEIYNDACSTRTVFYDKYSLNTMVSSHATLIANLMGYEISSEAIYFFHNRDYKNAVMKKLPGLISPYQTVNILTPNTKLNLPSRKIERFFPYRNNPVYENYDELEKEVAELMITQLELLHKKSKISMSLTAGMDSRLSLAASREISDDIEYFTYVTKNKMHIEDVEIAKEICREFNLTHKLYGWDECCNEGYDDFDYIWEKNMGIRRGIVWLNKIYVDSYPKDRIHVRSNIAEVVKADSDLYKYDMLSAKQLAYLYTTTPMKKDANVINKFQEFIDITDLKEEYMFNYDYRDMFEWEYKMCQWHGWLLLESDMAHDTFLIYNNRNILAKMLSLPYEYRLSRKMFIGIIKRLWPELLKFPINKKYFE